MLGPRAQLPKDAGQQNPRVRRFRDDVVEAGIHAAPPMPRRRLPRHHGDEHTPPEVSLGAQPGSQHGKVFHMAEQYDDYLKAMNHPVSRPLTCLDDEEAGVFQMNLMRRLPSVHVDDQHGTLFHGPASSG